MHKHTHRGRHSCLHLCMPTYALTLCANAKWLNIFPTPKHTDSSPKIHIHKLHPPPMFLQKVNTFNTDTHTHQLDTPNNGVRTQNKQEADMIIHFQPTSQTCHTNIMINKCTGDHCQFLIKHELNIHKKHFNQNSCLSKAKAIHNKIIFHQSLWWLTLYHSFHALKPDFTP